MKPVNFKTLDLNLLVVFEALMEERQVSRAAERVGLSQPSMSHALRRLREIFDDELFVRAGNGISPTPCALALAPAVLPGLGHIRAGLKAGAQFAPDQVERSFVLDLDDIASFTLLPKILPQLREQAPHLRIDVRHFGFPDAFDKLRKGELDLIVNVFVDIPDEFESVRLCELPLVCVADIGNTAIAEVGSLNLELLKALPHIAYLSGSNEMSPVEAELNARAIRRNIAVTVPHYLALAPSVLGTDMLAIMDAHSVQHFRHLSDLAVYPLPVALPPLVVSLVWHRRSAKDAAHEWLRTMLTDAFKPFDEWRPEILHWKGEGTAMGPSPN